MERVIQRAGSDNYAADVRLDVLDAIVTLRDALSCMALDCMLKIDGSEGLVWSLGHILAANSPPLLH